MQKDSFTLKQINFPEKDNLVKNIDLMNSVSTVLWYFCHMN
jgi:hypothetical protein